MPDRRWGWYKRVIDNVKFHDINTFLFFSLQEHIYFPLYMPNTSSIKDNNNLSQSDNHSPPLHTHCFRHYTYTIVCATAYSYNVRQDISTYLKYIYIYNIFNIQNRYNFTMNELLIILTFNVRGNIIFDCTDNRWITICTYGLLSLFYTL